MVWKQWSDRYQLSYHFKISKCEDTVYPYLLRLSKCEDTSYHIFWYGYFVGYFGYLRRYELPISVEKSVLLPVLTIWGDTTIHIFWDWADAKIPVLISFDIGVLLVILANWEDMCYPYQLKRAFYCLFRLFEKIPLFISSENEQVHRYQFSYLQVLVFWCLF